MERITDPAEIDHPELQAFARAAVWVAKLEEAVEHFEDLVHDLVHAERLAERGLDEDDEAAESVVDVPLQDQDPWEITLEVVRERYEQDDAQLEEGLIAWLAKDPEHWSIISLILLNPWRTPAGAWRDDIPPWVLVLGSDALLAHFQHDPYGRRRVIDFDRLDPEGSL